MPLLSEIRAWIETVVQLRRVLARHVSLLSDRWSRVTPLIETAQHKVWILQTWLPNLRGERPYWARALQKPGLDFRIMLLDPNLAWARTICRGAINDLIEQNVKDIWLIHDSIDRKQLNPAKLSGRFYSCIPFGPVYIIDDKAYWGIYLADEDSMNGPVFSATISSRVGRQVESSYLAIWNTFDNRTGNLVLPDVRQDQGRLAVLDPRIAQLRDSLVPIGEDEIRRFALRGGVLAVIRHGQTDLNRANIYAGSLDVPINAAGRQAARAKSDRVDGVRWHRVIRSPLRRTQQTLDELLQPGAFGRVEISESLRERRMGDVEGSDKQGVDVTVPDYQGKGLTTSLYAKAHGGGESYTDVFNRLAPLLMEIVSSVGQGANILVCGHEGPMRMIDMSLRGLNEQDAVSAHIDNCQFLCYRSRALGA